MIEVYWGCFIGGVLFAVVSVVLGDVLEGIFELSFGEGPPLVQPITIVGAVTVFGGTGVMLSRYTPLPGVWVFVLSLFSAVIAFLLVYFFYIVPTDNAENSTAFTMSDLNGKLGEVITTIPRGGYGEVMIRTAGGNTNQIAASFEKSEIPSGTKVVVVEVRDHTLYVAPYSLEWDQEV